MWARKSLSETRFQLLLYHQPTSSKCWGLLGVNPPRLKIFAPFSCASFLAFDSLTFLPSCVTSVFIPSTTCEWSNPVNSSLTSNGTSTWKLIAAKFSVNLVPFGPTSVKVSWDAKSFQTLWWYKWTQYSVRPASSHHHHDPLVNLHPYTLALAQVGLVPELTVEHWASAHKAAGASGAARPESRGNDAHWGISSNAPSSPVGYPSRTSLGLDGQQKVVQHVDPLVYYMATKIECQTGLRP